MSGILHKEVCTPFYLRLLVLAGQAVIFAAKRMGAVITYASVVPGNLTENHSQSATQHNIKLPFFQNGVKSGLRRILQSDPAPFVLGSQPKHVVPKTRLALNPPQLFRPRF